MFQYIEQPPALAGEPVVAAFVHLNQTGFAQLAQSLRQPVLRHSEPAGHGAERLSGPA